MSVLVTYDVSTRHREVKALMIKLGYSDHWVHEGKTTYLPNTTLWKDTDATTAREDIKSVAEAAGTKLERALAVSFSGWASIFGQPHS